MFCLIETLSVLPSVCLHCHAEPANRRRGLGRRCYDDPKIRGEYDQIRPTHNTATTPDTDRVKAAPARTNLRRGDPGWIELLAARAAKGLPLEDLQGGVK